MKARLSGVLLCIGAFVLSMLLLLHLIENPMTTVPEMGENPESTVEDNPEDQEGDTPSTDVSTDVTSIEGVMAVAKETQNFFDTFATSLEVSADSLSSMLTKWHNAALYLEERANDKPGAALYTALETVFTEYTEALPTDAESFAQKTRQALDALIAVLIDEEGEASGRYPVLDTEENGNISLTLLRLWRASEKTPGSVTVTFGGEVAMGDYIGTSSYQETYAVEGARSPLRGLIPVFATDDLSIVSLGAPLTTYTVPEVPATEAFRGSAVEAYAKHLKDGGVDMVLLSTCHIRDFGETGYNDTKAALEKAGLTVVEDGTVTYFDTTAGKVAVIAHDLTAQGDVRYTEIPKAKITEAKQNGAVLVITYFHTAEAEETTAALANTLRDAAINGSDLVLASHEENIQGILLGGEEKTTSLVFSPGQLSYAAKTEAEKYSFLYQQSFSVSEDDTADNSRLIYGVNNHSVGKKPTFAPTLMIGAQGSAPIRSTLSAALPNFQGRPAQGELTYINVENA